jgi:hypothetical protein
MNETLLVVGHNHSRTKVQNTKKIKLKNLGTHIGFRICEIPVKYQNEFGKPTFNKNGYSFFPEL